MATRAPGASARVTILMCPASCDALQGDPMGKVDVELGCETVTVPR